MEKILVSACFLGANVRYNGVSKPLYLAKLKQWSEQGRLITVCPEVAGGLSVPRAPAEIQDNAVIDSEGKDVTRAFLAGAQHALTLCKHHNIKYALLKESSPSCGSNQIYDGSFTGQKISGKGITAQLLEENGISVYSEKTVLGLLEVLSD